MLIIFGKDYKPEWIWALKKYNKFTISVHLQVFLNKKKRVKRHQSVSIHQQNNKFGSLFLYVSSVQWMYMVTVSWTGDSIFGSSLRYVSSIGGSLSYHQYYRRYLLTGVLGLLMFGLFVRISFGQVVEAAEAIVFWKYLFFGSLWFSARVLDCVGVFFVRIHLVV